MELRGTPVSVNNTRGDFAGELTIPGCAGTGEVAPPRLTPGKLQSLPGVKASLRCQGSLLGRRLYKPSAVWPCIFR